VRLSPTPMSSKWTLAFFLRLEFCMHWLNPCHYESKGFCIYSFLFYEHGLRKAFNMSSTQHRDIRIINLWRNWKEENFNSWYNIVGRFVKCWRRGRECRNRNNSSNNGTEQGMIWGRSTHNKGRNNLNAKTNTRECKLSLSSTVNNYIIYQLIIQKSNTVITKHSLYQSVSLDMILNYCSSVYFTSSDLISLRPLHSVYQVIALNDVL
jgi:hypothetical protein